MSDEKLQIPSECYDIFKDADSLPLMERFSETYIEYTYFKRFSVTVSWVNRADETYVVDSSNEHMALMKAVQANSHYPNEMYNHRDSKVKVI